MTPGRYFYPLLNLNASSSRQGCQSNIRNEVFNDARYEKIDQQDEATLYKENQIYMELTSLPFSQVEITSSSYYYGFYTRNVISHDLSCEYSDYGLSRKHLKSHASAMSRVEFWHHLLLRLSLFTFGFSLIMSIPYIGLVIASVFIQASSEKV